MRLAKVISYELIVAAVLVAGCTNGSSSSSGTGAPVASVVVYAAASTREVLETIGKQFTSDTGTPVAVVPGPSSGLAKQIAGERKADLFLSADQASADYLAEKGLVAKRRDLLTNRLVVIVPADSTAMVGDLHDLEKPEFKRIAVAESKVPAGEYARDALTQVGNLDALRPKFVGGIDVKATLQFVARGEADAGFVYLTDTIGDTKVRVVLEVDPKLHRPIVYPLVLLESAEHKPAIAKLFDYLGSKSSAEIFRRAKFGVAE